MARGGVARELGDRPLLRVRHESAGTRHDARALGAESALEARTRLAARLELGRAPDPLVAPREHALDQRARERPVAVEVDQQALEPARERVPALDPRKRALRGLAVELACVVDDGRHGAHARQHRHLARERGAQGVDGLDAQARGIVQDAPAELAVAREGGVRERARAARVVLFRNRRAARRLVQRLQHAPAHLRGGLAREGDGEDLLGPLHDGEQAQHALDQEPRLARARGRLHDAGVGRVERRGALACVDDGPCRSHAPSSRASSPSRTSSSLRARVLLRDAAQPLVHAAERLQVAVAAGGEPALGIDARLAARELVAQRIDLAAPLREQLVPAGRMPARRAVLRCRLHVRQDAFFPCQAGEAQLAHLEARERHGAHLRFGLHGERVERELRIVGTWAEPRAGIRAARLVVDHRDAAVAEGVHPVHAAGKVQLARGERDARLALLHRERRTAAFDIEPFPGDAREALALELREASLEAAGTFGAQLRHRVRGRIPDERRETIRVGRGERGLVAQRVPQVRHQRVQQDAALGRGEPGGGRLQRTGFEAEVGVGAERAGRLVREHRGAARRGRHRERRGLRVRARAPRPGLARRRELRAGERRKVRDAERGARRLLDARHERAGQAAPDHHRRARC